jgi:broad specificity phosphatase PhoE
VILVRHGQSHFNAIYNTTRVDPGIADAGLTEAGVVQAKAAAAALRGEDVRVVLASPYTRTLQTAEVIAEGLGLSITVEPLVRERVFFSCDIGSPRSQLVAQWPAVDFGDLPERWWPDPEESEAELAQRCALFRAAAAQRPDWRHLVVVSHWGFIRGLTGQALTNGSALRFRPHDDPDPGA